MADHEAGPWITTIRNRDCATDGGLGTRFLPGFAVVAVSGRWPADNYDPTGVRVDDHLVEFRCVEVIGVSDGALPYPRAVTAAVDRLQHDADLLAERCLLFVACTPARDGLYVSWWGDPSEFLVEAGV